MKLCFIGGGNMASAMLAGLKNNQFEMQDVTVVELDAEKRQVLIAQFGVQASERLAVVENVDLIVLAVKPQQLKALALDLLPWIKQQLVVSIAAGIRSTDLSRWLGGYAHIVRAMPNTPGQIQAGVTGLYAPSNVTAEQRIQAGKVLEAIGKVVWCDDEAKLDAVTAISGSGPAYVFYFIEALQEAGVALGLSEADARLLSLETFRGAGLLAASSNEAPSVLRARVTSKGGTTEQGVLALETAGVKQAIINAARAAALRSCELGDLLGKD